MEVCRNTFNISKSVERIDSVFISGVGAVSVLIIFCILLSFYYFDSAVGYNPQLHKHLTLAAML